MTAAAAISHRAMVLPWTGSSADEKRFRRILGQVMLLCLLLGWRSGCLPVPKVEHEQPEELSPRLAKLLLEHQPLPPPPVVKPVPLPEPKSALPKQTTAKPRPEKIPVPEARQPIPEKPPGEVLEAARKKARRVGLLAMKEELQELHGAPLAMQLKDNIKQGPGVGTGVGAGVGSGQGLGIPTRSLITSNATGGSGGINTARFSRRHRPVAGWPGVPRRWLRGVAAGGGGGGPGEAPVRCRETQASTLRSSGSPGLRAQQTGPPGRLRLRLPPPRNQRRGTPASRHRRCRG